MILQKLQLNLLAKTTEKGFKRLFRGDFQGQRKGSMFGGFSIRGCEKRFILLTVLIGLRLDLLPLALLPSGVKPRHQPHLVWVNTGRGGRGCELTLYGPNSFFLRFSGHNLRWALFVYRLIGATLKGFFLFIPF